MSKDESMDLKDIKENIEITSYLIKAIELARQIRLKMDETEHALTNYAALKLSLACYKYELIKGNPNSNIKQIMYKIDERIEKFDKQIRKKRGEQ